MVHKKINQKRYFSKLKGYLSSVYELTDSNIKFYSLLFEIRTANYPNRLKIEMRKETKPCDFEQKIASSPYATRQVALRVYTLGQTLRNKIAAALDRKDIRDCFDIEFLLR
ncbi:MAG: nucleotidyl transferase AbiEii/AbiGii toxin family protein [Candidatus Omnitrophica bacterium]|nr:nucleotidyl transferase AbiEii/AbiGii toxin family protein [Candidatus Omnitrophota bacterium]